MPKRNIWESIPATRFAVCHDRRSVGDLIQQFDDLARLVRPGITASPAGEHFRIQDPLDVFWSPALALDVPRHVFAMQGVPSSNLGAPTSLSE